MFTYTDYQWIVDVLYDLVSEGMITVKEWSNFMVSLAESM